MDASYESRAFVGNDSERPQRLSSTVYGQRGNRIGRQLPRFQMKTGFMAYLRLTRSDVETDSPSRTRHPNPLSVYSTIFLWGCGEGNTIRWRDATTGGRQNYESIELDKSRVDLLRSSVEGVKVAEFEPDPLSFLSGEFVGAG